MLAISIFYHVDTNFYLIESILNKSLRIFFLISTYIIFLSLLNVFVSFLLSSRTGGLPGGA